MAHIFKKASPGNKGIILLTHKEEHILTPEFCNKYKDLYFMGMSYGSHHVNIRKHPFQDFCMATPALASFSGEEPFRIPLSSRSFTPAYFREDEKVYKEWDLINISRNANYKNLHLFLHTIRKLYDAGHKLKVLLVIPSCLSETRQNHFVDIVKVYRELFSTEEQEYFTLLRLSVELGFMGISPRTVAHFYKSSKVATLLSAAEGASKSVHEALLCGLPMVCYKGIQGGSGDYLDDTNSIRFTGENEIADCFLKAVKNYKTINTNSEKLAEELREDKTVPKLKEYFKELYKLHGQEFDGQLIDTDHISHRLPGHFFDVPWAGTPSPEFPTADIKTQEQLQAFCKELE